MIKTLTPGKSIAHSYLNDIGRAPLLTPDQEIDLGRKVRRAQELQELDRELTRSEQREVLLGARAKNKFIRSNLRLVVSCAKQYSNLTRSMELMDLVQEGNIGLITAVERFDPTMGYRFSTFAYWWIRQGIRRAIAKKDRAIYMPGRISEMASAWGAKSQKLRAELGRAPTDAELAAVFNVKEHDVLLFKERGGMLMSLDGPVPAMLGSSSSEVQGKALVDVVTDYVAGEGPLDAMIQDERVALILDALAGLSERDRDIIGRRLGLDGNDEHTLADVAKVYGMSRERVRQIQMRAMNRLKLYMNRVEQEYVRAELPLLPVQ